MTPKELTHLIRNAQSTIGDPGVSIDLVKNRLKGLVEVLEQHGEKIFALPNYSTAVVNLMLEVHMLKTTAQEKQEEEKENNVVSLQLITGGKEPPDLDCWLGKKSEGDMFWVQTASENTPGVPSYIPTMFALVKKMGYVYILRTVDMNSQQSQDVPVNPIRFCKLFSKLQDFTPPKEQPTEGVGKDGTDEQSDRAPAGDEPADQAEEVAGPKGVPEFL